MGAGFAQTTLQALCVLSGSYPEIYSYPQLNPKMPENGLQCGSWVFGGKVECRESGGLDGRTRLSNRTVSLPAIPAQARK